MPSIAREQENTTSLINWFLTVNGVLTDAFLVEYRILDITGGLPGVQVFPTTPSPSYHDVTAGNGHFSTGSYYAYDNNAQKGWTPPVGLNVGTHRVEWRWKITSLAGLQTGYEDIEVVASSEGSSSRSSYISVADVRAAGITTAMVSDSAVQAAIEVWQAFLERACRQWFYPRLLTFRFDGTDSDTIHFGVPIISVDHVKINNSTDKLDPSYYKVYGMGDNPVGDDRHNPRIKLIGADDDLSIYTAPMIVGGRRLKFRKGRQNQEVKGTFGYVEADGSTPPLIKHALLKLVIEKLTHPVFGTFSGGEASPLMAQVLEEETDGHRMKYAVSAPSPRKPGLSGVTSDQEILDIIRLYRAPIGLATPAHPNYA